MRAVLVLRDGGGTDIDALGQLDLAQAGSLSGKAEPASDRGAGGN